jgi:hypothetical protein
MGPLRQTPSDAIIDDMLLHFAHSIVTDSKGVEPCDHESGVKTFQQPVPDITGFAGVPLLGCDGVGPDAVTLDVARVIDAYSGCFSD